MTTIKDRLSEFLKAKKIDKTQLDVLIEASNGVTGKFINGKNEMGVNKVGKILQNYPDLSAEWLMRGEGKMLMTIDNSNTHNSGNINNGNSNINGDVSINEHNTLIGEVEFLRGQLLEKDRQLKNRDEDISFFKSMLEKLK